MSLDLGFETIGNATLVAHDGGPVLATDPWLFGPAYFGSWTLSHSIPEEQMAAIKRCDTIWVSHGHPDHLSMPSLEQLRDKRILIPDHVGGRIFHALKAAGYRVEVMTDRTWYQISPRVRVLSIADFNQDAILLLEIGGALVIDANDASDRGWGHTVRRIAQDHDPVFLLALSGYGDADMINFFDEEGTRIAPYAARRLPPGVRIRQRMEQAHARYFVPFASMHRYQREDSVWANEYTTPLSDHVLGFESATREVLPAFIRYDCARDELSTIDPAPNACVTHPAQEFGDDWSETLAPEEVDLVRDYFTRITTLQGVVDTIVMRVGGQDHRVPIGTTTGRTVTFEVPRHSLVESVRYEIFDDLLIGNYMRTTLGGDWGGAFAKEFSPLVAKYADNGLARTPAELRTYLATYRRRAQLDMIRWKIARRREEIVVDSARRIRARVAPGTPAHRLGQAAYRRIRPS